jgi:DNA-binding transcriptional MocR family regulator
MNTSGKVSIRNLRKAEWYWIDKNILRQYGKLLKPTGIAVYNGLAFFANAESHTCFPSQEALGGLVGASKRTVRRHLQQMEALGLIKTEKRRGTSLYHLLSPGTILSPREDKSDPGEWSPAPPNKNNRTRITKQNIDNKDFRKFDSPVFKGFKPQTREEVLALDLAQGLDDPKGLPLYLSLSRKLPESLLRQKFSEVRAIPTKQIKKSRGALFNFLIQRHAKYPSHHPGN